MTNFFNQYGLLVALLVAAVLLAAFVRERRRATAQSEAAARSEGGAAERVREAEVKAVQGWARSLYEILGRKPAEWIKPGELPHYAETAVVELVRRERAATNAAAQAAVELKAALRTAADAEARCQRQFEQIQRFEAQRDVAHDRYHQAVLEMSNAQSLMLREIGRLARVSKEPVRPMFQQVVDEFRGRHDAEKGSVGRPEAIEKDAEKLLEERQTFGLTEAEKEALVAQRTERDAALLR